MTDRITLGNLLKVISDGTHITIECEDSVLWRGWRSQLIEDEADNTLTVEEVWVHDTNTLVIEVCRILD